MQYTLYVDRIFFLHFVMNFFLLLLTAKLGNCQTKIKRLLGAAAVSAFFFVAVLVIPADRMPAAVGVKTGAAICAGLGALQTAFQFRSREGLIRAALWYAASACVLGGVLGAGYGIAKLLFCSRLPESVGMTGLLAAAVFAAAAGMWLGGRERRAGRNACWRAELVHGNVKRTVTALMDSGNSLYDPFTGRPVCIVEAGTAEALGILSKPEKIHIIPYHSIGKQHGLLQAAAVDEVYLEKEGQERRIKQVMLAVSPHGLSADGRYQLILHPVLLEEMKGENHDIESSNAGKDAV